MHISRGRPLISALHEPHLPALQFQRTARSPAWVACSRWMRVEDDLALVDLDGVVAELAAVDVAAPDAHLHVVAHQSSSLDWHELVFEARPASIGQRLVLEVDGLPRRRRRPACSTRLTVPHSGSGPGKSSRVCPPRLSCALERRPGDALGDDAACSAGRAPGASPGCTAGGPRPTGCLARSLSSLDLAQRLRSSSAVRMMPTRSLHRRPAGRAGWCTGSRRPRSRTARAPPLAAASTSLVGDRRPRRASRGGVRTPRCWPARRPNTSRSDSELPPSRLEPCMPPATSPAAYRPGDERLLGVGVDLDAAHHVVAGRPDLHRLGGDVDVGQLLELVVHRRQPLRMYSGVAPRGDVEEHAAVR